MWSQLIDGRNNHLDGCECLKGLSSLKDKIWVYFQTVVNWRRWANLLLESPIKLSHCPIFKVWTMSNQILCTTSTRETLTWCYFLKGQVKCVVEWEGGTPKNVKFSLSTLAHGQVVGESTVNKGKSAKWEAKSNSMSNLCLRPCTSSAMCFCP